MEKFALPCKNTIHESSLDPFYTSENNEGYHTSTWIVSSGYVTIAILQCEDIMHIH